MHAHGREAAGGPFYGRYRPDATQLYRLVKQHYPAFVAHLRDSEPGCGLRFTRVKASGGEEPGDLVQRIAERVGPPLERMELLASDAESAWLGLPPIEDTDAMGRLIGSSVTYRIALGSQSGRKARVLRTITPLALRSG